MKKRLFILGLIISLAVRISEAQSVSNISFETVVNQDKGTALVVITYDLKSFSARYYAVKAYVVSGKNRNGMELKTVKGAVGDSIQPGTQKKIFWNVFSDTSELNGEISFRIEALEMGPGKTPTDKLGDDIYYSQHKEKAKPAITPGNDDIYSSKNEKPEKLKSSTDKKWFVSYTPLFGNFEGNILPVAPAGFQFGRLGNIGYNFQLNLGTLSEFVTEVPGYSNSGGERSFGYISVAPGLSFKLNNRLHGSFGIGYEYRENYFKMDDGEWAYNPDITESNGFVQVGMMYKTKILLFSGAMTIPNGFLSLGLGIVF